MENSEEGVVSAEVCSPVTGLRFCTLPRDIYAPLRTYYVHDQTFSAKKEKKARLRSGLGMDM